MRRAAESMGGSAAAAPTAPSAGERGALREHALALDASERDRDKYKALLSDAEKRAEQLLEMNAQLKTELEVERAATDADANAGADAQHRDASAEVLRASLLDAQRRLKETETQLSAVSEGFQLLKRERAEAMTVLQSSESVRAALDEERGAVAQLHADLARRQTQMTALAAQASDSIERTHSELLVAAAREDGHGGGSQTSEMLKRAATDLKALRTQIATGVSAGTAPHFEGLLATEEVAADDATTGGDGGGRRLDSSSSSSVTAALAAENEALRQSIAAQNDRIEALRSDLTNARDGEAAATEKLRAARVVVANANAGADVEGAGEESGAVAGGTRVGMGAGGKDDEAASLLRVELEASRELSRRQEREREAEVNNLREELQRQADVISSAYAGELEGMRARLDDAERMAEAHRAKAERAEKAATKAKETEVEAVKRSVAMAEELRDTPSRREVSTLQKRLELRETEVRDLRNEVWLLQQHAAVRDERFGGNKRGDARNKRRKRRR